MTEEDPHDLGTEHGRLPGRRPGEGKALYGALLGVPPHTDQPYSAGYRVGDQEVGLDPHGAQKGMTGPVGYWHVEDHRAAVAALVTAGATEGPVQDFGGKLVGTVTDLDGNVVGLVQETGAAQD